LVVTTVGVITDRRRGKRGNKLGSNKIKWNEWELICIHAAVA
jgi:hypothetical protein